MRQTREVVSVVITTYYRNDRLRGAIESALSQTYPTVEVVVIDDSGEAHAKSVADEYDVKYISHDVNKGTNTARNTGIEGSSGRYVQLLDDDDRLHREKVQAQMEAFAVSDSTGVVYCGVTLKGDSETREVLPDPDVSGDVLACALTLDPFPCYTSSMLIDREYLDRVLPLAVRPTVDDLWLMIELAKITEFDHVARSLVTKRQTDSSLGQGMTNARERFNLIEEYDELYEKFPAAVRGTALGNTHHQTGSLLFDERIWSFKATLAYWKALYYRPEPSAQFVGACIASLLGKPGISAAKSLRSLVA